MLAVLFFFLLVFLFRSHLKKINLPIYLPNSRQCFQSLQREREREREREGARERERERERSVKLRGLRRYTYPTAGNASNLCRERGREREGGSEGGREREREICETFRKKTNFYPPKKDVYVDSMFLRDFVLFMYSMSVYMYQYHNGHINKTTASNVSSFQIKDPHTPLHIKKVRDFTRLIK